MRKHVYEDLRDTHQQPQKLMLSLTFNLSKHPKGATPFPPGNNKDICCSQIQTLLAQPQRRLHYHHIVMQHMQGIKPSSKFKPQHENFYSHHRSGTLPISGPGYGHLEGITVLTGCRQDVRLYICRKYKNMQHGKQ